MFKENSLYNRSFLFLGKLIGLNLLWMACCLPVVTAGASTTALFYCQLRLHKNGDCNIFRDFWKSFRSNFFQATLLWAGLLAAALVLYVEKRAIGSMPGALSDVYAYVCAAAGAALVMTALYVFPTLAAFENKSWKILRNACGFALQKPLYLLAVAAITILPMYCTLLDGEMFGILLFVWLLLGFSLTAYADSWFFWRLFRPYLSNGK